MITQFLRIVKIKQLFFFLLVIALLGGIAVGKTSSFNSLDINENDSIKKHISPVIGLGGYNSLIAGQKVDVFGLRIGAEFNKRYRLGIGAYKLNTAVHGVDLNQYGVSYSLYYSLV